MIDAATLARFVHEEIRTCAPRSHTNDPVLNDDELFERQIAKAPLADEQSLASVIEEVFWASMLTEEGRSCRPRLVYAPGPNSSTHQFAPSLRLKREVLRKLSPAQGTGLVWGLHDSRPTITGLHPRRDSAIGVTVAAPAAGAIEVTWGNLRVLSYSAGRCLRLSEVGFGDLVYAMTSVQAELKIGSLASLMPVVQAIMQQGHGGSVWVTQADSITDDAVSMERAIELDDRALVDRFPSASDEAERLAWLESVGALAAVDGAVLVDSKLRLLGFGAFLKAVKTVRVQRWRDGNRARLTDSDDGWGGRHRSAAAFCHRFAPAAAFVVSEDGGVSTFSAVRGGIVQHRSVLAVGSTS